MASQAEIDLVVNASNTLNQLEGDLDRVVRAAQASTDPVTIAAVMDQQNAVAAVLRDVDRVVAAAQAGAPDIDLDAALDQQASLRRIQRQLNNLVDEAEAGQVSRITMRAALNVPNTVSQISRDLRRVAQRVDNDVTNLLPPPPPLRIEIDEDSLRRFDSEIERVRRGATSALKGIVALSAGTVALGSAIGSALPLVAGLVTAVESIAPAAAAGTTGMLALVLATNTVKLAMIGVEDAIQNAFDPDVKPEALEKSLKRLAPNARDFVLELRGMRSEFRGLQQSVQNQFFENFDNVVRQLGRTVLPQLSTALVRTSGTFNEMTRRAAAAAVALSESGVLGQALKGATSSLQNLRDVPAQAVTGFGALAAAAAPALDRITKKVAEISLRISENLVDKFRSGELTKSIDEAFANLASLGRSVSNVFAGLGNIFRGLQANGRGLFETLEDITGTFRQVTGSREFQSVLGELARTAATLGNNLKIVVGPALGALGALFEALAPSVRKVLDSLGPTLAGALEDLKPLFDGVGDAVGGFLEAASPLVDLAIELIGLIGGALGPIFATLGDIFRSMAPVLRQVADNFLAVARPILEQLGPAFEKVFPKFSEAAERIFPKVADVLARLEPGFKKLGEAVAQLLPLLAEINAIIVDKLIAAFEELAPIFEPLARDILDLLVAGLEQLAFILENFVVPALSGFVDFLNGDTRAAGLKFIELSRQIDKFVTAAFESLRDHAIAAVNTFAGRIVTRINVAMIESRAAVERKLAEIVQFFRNLPGRIESALGNLGSVLFNEGAAIVEGMIRGVQAKAGELFARLADIARRAKNTVTSILGIASPSKVFATIGDDMIAGLRVGIERSSDALRRDLQGLAFSMPAMVGAGAGSLVVPQQQAPVVNATVLIGNQVVDRYVDVRVERGFARRDRVAAQGVRF